MPEIVSLFAALLSAFLGGLIPIIGQLFKKPLQRYYDINYNKFLGKLVRNLFSLRKSGQLAFSERIADSLTLLKRSSEEIDKVIVDVTAISQEKQAAILALEAQLNELSHKESELKRKIESLERVPVESLQYFEELLKKGDRSSARRDYLLFASGVVVSTLIAIVLRLVGY